MAQLFLFPIKICIFAAEFLIIKHEIMKKGTLIGIVGALLLAALVGITYLLFMEKQANREMIEEFRLEKEDLENDRSRRLRRRFLL